MKKEEYKTLQVVVGDRRQEEHPVSESLHQLSPYRMCFPSTPLTSWRFLLLSEKDMNSEIVLNTMYRDGWGVDADICHFCAFCVPNRQLWADHSKRKLVSC